MFFNLLVHLSAGLTLLGIVRRTLTSQGENSTRALRIAFAAALLWVLHPVQDRVRNLPGTARGVP